MRYKKLLTITLALLMLLSLCACDDDNSNAGVSNDSNTKSANAVEDEKLTPYESLFANGGLCVQDENGLWGYIDKDCNYIIEPQFADAYSFDNKLAKVQSAENGLYGFINKKGEYVIEPQFKQANNFNEELAVVKSAENGLFGFINEKGKYVIEPQFIKAYNFDDGLAIVTTENGVQYINKSGKQAFAGTYEEAYAFSDDMAVVMQNGLYGYINRQGEMVIEPQFAEVFAFNDGVAYVQIESKDSPYNLIDKGGKILTDAKVEKTSWRSASDTQKERAVDTNGLYEVLIFDYEYLYDGQASVVSKHYFINNKGEIVLPKADSERGGYYKDIRNFDDGYAPVKDSISNLWGVIDVEGNWVIAPQFQNYVTIEYCDEELVCVSEAAGYSHDRDGYIDGYFMNLYCFDKQGNLLKESSFLLSGSGYIVGADYKKNFVFIILNSVGNLGEQFWDFDGNMIMDYTFDDIYTWRFNDTSLDCAIVKYNGMYGIIDGGGNWLIEPMFQDVR